jgi:hypothetical protein
MVEAEHSPIIANFVIGKLTLRGIHTQAPLRKTIALYR